MRFKIMQIKYKVLLGYFRGGRDLVEGTRRFVDWYTLQTFRIRNGGTTGHRSRSA